MIKFLEIKLMIQYKYRVAGVNYQSDRKEKNMTGILIVTHHNLANAFLETIEMIAGKHEFIDSLGLLPSHDPETFKELILDKVHALKGKGYDEIVVVLDLYGGTPCNQTIRLLREHQLKVIVGVNLPMMLQMTLLNTEEHSAEELADTAVESGKEGIFDVGKSISKFM